MISRLMAPLRRAGVDRQARPGPRLARLAIGAMTMSLALSGVSLGAASQVALADCHDFPSTMEDNDLFGNYPGGTIHIWWTAHFDCRGVHTQETADYFDFNLGQDSTVRQPQMNTHARTWVCGTPKFDSSKASPSHDARANTSDNSYYVPFDEYGEKSTGYNSDGGYQSSDRYCAPQADVSAWGHTSGGRQWSGYIHECSYHSTTYACNSWKQQPGSGSASVQLNQDQVARVALAMAGRLAPRGASLNAVSAELHRGLTNFTAPASGVSYRRTNPMDIWTVDVAGGDATGVGNLRGTMLVSADAVSTGTSAASVDSTRLALLTPTLVGGLVSFDGPPDVPAADVNVGYNDPAPSVDIPDTAGPLNDAFSLEMSLYSTDPHHLNCPPLPSVLCPGPLVARSPGRADAGASGAATPVGPRRWAHGPDVPL